MRFLMPNHPCAFDLPDAWITEAGLIGFTPALTAYRSTTATDHLLLTGIEPPFRSPNVPEDGGGFDHARLVSVLRGFAAGADIEPVPVLQLVTDEAFLHLPYGYRVCDGYHRFFASIAAGFTHLPVTVRATLRAVFV